MVMMMVTGMMCLVFVILLCVQLIEHSMHWYQVFLPIIFLVVAFGLRGLIRYLNYKSIIRRGKAVRKKIRSGLDG